MSSKLPFLLVGVLALFALGSFYLFQRQVTRPLVRFVLGSEMIDILNDSMEDLKTLAQLDDEHAQDYRSRFEKISDLRNNFSILMINRTNLVRTYETTFLLVVAMILILSGTTFLISHLRTEAHLVRMRDQLAALSSEDATIPSGKARRGIFKRIELMIQDQSRKNHEHRSRLRYLEHLSSWQESARRHAHEIRTPLTAARLELESLYLSLREKGPQPLPTEWTQRHENILHQLNRLKDFTTAFASFGKIATPRMHPTDLVDLLGHFGELYEEVWTNVTLKIEPIDPLPFAIMDADLIRQVLVNLCQNASQAIAERERTGTITFRSYCQASWLVLETRDDGPGIPSELQTRIFEPYVTTKGVGEGMGLGLAIAKKILLDHEGDLILVESNERGTCFQIRLPIPAEEAA